MYNQVIINQLPHPVDRETVTKYLSCAHVTYMIYGVLQILGGIVILTQGGVAIGGSIVLAVVLILSALKCQDCKRMLRQHPFDQGKLRKDLKFTYCINWVVVVMNFVGMAAVGFLFYLIFKNQFNFGTIMTVYAGVCVFNIVVLIPFFVLIGRTGAVKEAVEVLCGPTFTPAGVGSINAQPSYQQGGYSPAPAQAYNQQPQPTQGYNNYGNGGFGGQGQGGYQTGPQQAKQGPGGANQNYNSPF